MCAIHCGKWTGSKTVTITTVVIAIAIPTAFFFQNDIFSGHNVEKFVIRSITLQPHNQTIETVNDSWPHHIVHAHTKSHQRTKEKESEKEI